jgi:hypothetical protein
MPDILTYRATIYPWHCDHMVHINVMWCALLAFVRWRSALLGCRVAAASGAITAMTQSQQ